MWFKAKLRGSIVAGLAFGAAISAHAAPNVCVVSLRQLDNPGAKSYALTCLESANACSSFVAIEIDGKQRTVAVEATCVPGNVELKFWTAPEQEDLSIDSWPALHIATGAFGTARREFVLTAASEKVGDVQGLLQRPVIRGSTSPLATVEVEVTLKQAD